MALEEFWSHIQGAASNLRSTAQPPLWLKARTMAGFDIADFGFLEETERSALEAAVNRFLAVARQVTRKQPATPEQIAEATPALEEILRILDPTHYAHAEALRVQTLLRRELADDLPKWVTKLSCETRDDSLGEPGIWIWLDVTDDAVDKGYIEEHGMEVYQTVKDAFEDVGSRRYPFVRMRSPDVPKRRRGVSA